MCFCLVFPDAPPESHPPLNHISMGYYARSCRGLSKPTVLSHSGNVQRTERAKKRGADVTHIQYI